MKRFIHLSFKTSLGYKARVKGVNGEGLQDSEAYKWHLADRRVYTLEKKLSAVTTISINHVQYE